MKEGISTETVFELGPGSQRQAQWDGAKHLIAPGSIPRSLLRTFNFEIWKLKCLGACPEDLYFVLVIVLVLEKRMPAKIRESGIFAEGRRFVAA